MVIGLMAASVQNYSQVEQGPAVATLRALLNARRAERRPLSLDEAIATVVPLCTDLQERHARGERLYVHPSCVAPGPQGLAQLEVGRAVLPTDPHDMVCMAPELVQTRE